MNGLFFVMIFVLYVLQIAHCASISKCAQANNESDWILNMHTQMYNVIHFGYFYMILTEKKLD